MAIGSVPAGLGERIVIWIAGERKDPPAEGWSACLFTGLRTVFRDREDVSHIKTEVLQT